MTIDKLRRGSNTFHTRFAKSEKINFVGFCVQKNQSKIFSVSINEKCENLSTRLCRATCFARSFSECEKFISVKTEKIIAFVWRKGWPWKRNKANTIKMFAQQQAQWLSTLARIFMWKDWAVVRRHDALSTRSFSWLARKAQRADHFTRFNNRNDFFSSRVNVVSFVTIIVMTVHYSCSFRTLG